jgi:heterodisulfide reductase subunit A-like polyferredoxin
MSRHIDPDACTACGDCAEVCPVVRPSEYDSNLATRKATYKRYAQAIPSGFAIEKLDTAPCRMACPARVNVQGYVQMVKQGKYLEAIKIIMRDLPFPGVLGRICTHRCEKSCRRLEVDEAISIMELKRVAADHVNLSDIPVPEMSPRKERVAVIGAGPAGLTAAYFLALDGYKVSVYEGMPEPGGMLRYGIPAHRLPRSVLDAEIKNLKRYGIEIHTSTIIGKDITIKELQEHGAKAIFIASGAWRGIRLNLPGEGHPDVVHVSTLVREVELGERRRIDGRPIVFGAGHSGIDATRVALRLGTEVVHVVEPFSLEQMPAGPEEFADIEAEGAKFHFQALPKRIIIEKDKIVGVECIRTRLTEPDTTGRRKFIPVEGSEFFIEADFVISAVGQEPDLDFLGKDYGGLEVSKWNLLAVNPETLQTNRPEIFAGGDVITGSATVIEAVEAGKRAARYMGMYLRGEELPTEWQEETPIGENWVEIPANEAHRSRLKVPTLPLEKRLSGFEEVKLPVSEEAAQEEAGRCLNCGVCCECYQCIEACKAHAVTLETHAQQEQILSIDVGSVILAPGFQPFDPSRFETYNYANHPNVLTSMEFERILSATGPYQGHLLRPSDNEEPKKIAWVQCVGSRNINQCDKTYCSSVCCMYAIKEAIVAKEHTKEPLDTAIFYIDIRTHGKDFERYYNRAKEQGVRFIKSRIANVVPLDDTGNLLIRYTDEAGRRVEEEFDMVVLSVGLEASREALDLAARLGIKLSPHGFSSASSFEPVWTSEAGIFACGVFQGPKDIPQSVVESSACAAVVESTLAAARWTLTRTKEAPIEIDLRGESPRIGLFICNCGINIGGIVDVHAVVEYGRNLPGVVFVEENLFTCSQDTQEKITQVIKEQRLNRVVVAACSPRTHEELFQETVVNAGINKYLFEMANIRNQCSWVHSGDPEAATKKAKDLVRMAVSKVALLEPLSQPVIEMNQSAMVIGGGLSGIAAAKNLAEQGYQTYLIEKSDALGGQAMNLYETWRGENVRENLARLIQDIKSNENINIFLSTELKNVDGFLGNFKSTIETAGKERVIEHGVAIIATGASEFKPDQYLYGQDPHVLTGLELDRKFIDGNLPLKEINSAVFIQCVGSRVKERPYCSKVCCTHSVKGALKLKELKPEMEVFIVYRDMRTYGLREDLYREARDKGVMFIRYDHDKELKVTRDQSNLQVRFTNYILQREVEINPDLLVLATAIVPPNENPIAQLFKVPVNEDGFFVEAHAKLRPMDFSTDGVFVCGLAHSPKPVDEAVAQGLGAASRAATLLSKEKVFGNAIVSQIDQQLCRGCQQCLEVCPYQAIRYLGDRVICEVNQVVCKGCGACSAICPTGAAAIGHFTDNELLTMVEAALLGS